MSHTFEDSNSDTLFHYNPDLSGDVTIRAPNGELEVEGSALRAFLAEWLRTQLIGAIEDSDDNAILRFSQIIRDGT